MTPFNQLKEKFQRLGIGMGLDTRQWILFDHFWESNFKEAYQQTAISERELAHGHNLDGLREHLEKKCLYTLAEFMKNEKLFTTEVVTDDYGSEITRVNMVFFKVEHEKK